MKHSIVLIILVLGLLSCSKAAREKKEEARRIHGEALHLYSMAQMNAALTDEVEQALGSLFDRSIALDPEYAAPYASKAHLLEKRGKDKEALAVIDSGIQMIGENEVKLLISRAGLYEKLGKNKEAHSDLEKLLTLFNQMADKEPDSFYALSNRAILLALTQNIPAGLKELERIPTEQMPKEEKFQLHFLKKTLTNSTREEIFERIRM